VQSSTCVDVNIWSRNEEKKGLAGEMREGIGEIGEKMGEKMGEEGCEGERETARVSSSVGVVVNVQWSQIRDPWLWGWHLSGPSLKVDDFW
jgi:hypothetical protein